MSFKDFVTATASPAIIDALGAEIEYIPAVGERSLVNAIVDVETFTVETEYGSYTTYQARMDAKSTDMPNLAEGDVVRYNKGTDAAPEWVEYCVFNPEDDGLGIVSAWLAFG